MPMPFDPPPLLKLPTTAPLPGSSAAKTLLALSSRVPRKR
jgi:hypothetical protein